MKNLGRNNRGKLLVGTVFAAVMLQSLATSNAQTVLGTATLYQEPSIRPATPSLVDPMPTDVPPPVLVPLRSTLRHLPAIAQPLRLDGEWSTLEWPLVMTANEARETSRFRVAYQSAASVLPDVSRLSLFINGTLAGRSSIAAPGDVRPIDFKIDPKTLREGTNSIRLTAEQRHRVDCTADATYELWTDIDPVRTGFVSPERPPVFKLNELAALRFRADGALVIRVRVNAPMSPTRVDQAIRAAQAIALIGQHQRVVVTLTPDDDATDGITLAFGDGAAQPRLLLRTEREGAAPTLLISGATDADIALAVADLVALAEAKTSTGREFSGDETLGLLNLGLLNDGAQELSFFGHFAQLPVAFDMPADFLAADYGKMTLDLVGRTAGGLEPGTQIQIKLNGHEAGGVALSSGKPFHHRGIAIPLGGLRPGRNTIEIAAKLTTATACGSQQSLDNAAPLLTLSSASTIHLPSLARIGQVPNLAQFAAGGFPFSVAGARPKLYVPSPDRDTMAATMTLAVQLALVAHHPIAFETVIGNPSGLPGHGLVVAPARALDRGLLSAIGMNPDALRDAWQARADATDDSKRVVVVAAPPVAAPSGWTVSQAIAKAALSVQGWLGRNAFVALDRIDPAASLIVAQGFRSDDSPDAITIVTAPNAQALRSGVEALATPLNWSRQTGGIMILDQSAEIVASIPASHVRFVETQTVSLGNTRLIVAGWLSVHPAIYTLSALLLALVLGLATRLLVKNVGRRNVS